MDIDCFCTLRWSNHVNNVNRFLSVSYAEEKYTDVAFACDGHVLKAHKIVLAGCSPYFENLFSKYCPSNMCIAIESVAYPILRLVLEFMYCGEIRVKHSQLGNLMRAGRHLKVKGLDGIIVSDLQRSEEHTILIARPSDDYQNLQSAMGTRPATHSPEPPMPKIPLDAVHIPVPRPKLKQEPKEALPVDTEEPDPSSKRPNTRRVARVSLVEPQNSLPSASNKDAVEPNLEPENTPGTSEEVKHSQLGNLMRAGRHLKVKGLDGIIVSDLQRSEEHTILIARPSDDYQNLQSAMGTRPATHSPEPPKPKIPLDAVHIPVPRPKLKQEPKEALPVDTEEPDPSSKRPNTRRVARVSLAEPQNSLPSASNEDAVEPNLEPENTPGTSEEVKHSQLGNLMRAGRHLKVKGLDGIIVSDLQRSEEHTILIARPSDDYQNLQSAMGTRPATHSPEPPKPKIPLDAVHIPVPRPKLKQEPKEALPVDTEEPDPSSKRPNTRRVARVSITSDEPADQPPATIQSESLLPFPGFVEVATSRSRIIKKFACMADTEFNFEPEAPNVKKRRTRKVYGGVQVKVNRPKRKL